jgi:hypothetical protein
LDVIGYAQRYFDTASRTLQNKDFEGARMHNLNPTAPITLKLEARQIGRKNALVPSWNLELRDLPEPLTLKALLEQIVRSEVEKYNQRQSNSKFVRALTQTQLEAAAESGKISLGGHEAQAQYADAREAVETALLAFQDGLYHVFLNDAQLEDLDAKIVPRDGMSLLFLRLVALAGG